MFTEKIYSFLRNLNRVSLLLVTKKGTLDFSCVHFKLLKRSSSERISANQTNAPPLLHVVIGKLCASRGFTSSLKTDKHDNVRFPALKLIRLVLGRQHKSQLINDRLGDETT